MFAIFKRELRSYFTSLVGYVVIGVMLAFTGLYYSANCLVYGTSDFSTVLYSTTLVMLFLLPALTMRSFADERRNKTDQLLLTSPVGIPSIVMGKYFAQLAVFAVQYAETLHKTCQLAIVICDRDAVVASAGVPKKDYGDRKISAEFEDLIEKRSFFASKDSSEKICITEGADTFVSCAMPIIAEGDIAGAVASVISDRDQRVCAEDIEEKLIQTAALFLGKQLES